MGSRQQMGIKRVNRAGLVAPANNGCGRCDRGFFDDNWRRGAVAKDDLR